MTDAKTDKTTDAKTDKTTDETKPVIQEFPKMLYHKDGNRVVVNSREEQDKLGGGWLEAPPTEDASKKA